jgi:hypothetical protein
MPVEHDKGVMTWLARLLLVLTSIAPIVLVYSAVLLDKGCKSQAYWGIFGASFLAVACILLLWLARNGTQPSDFAIERPQERDGDSLAFLVAYALPLVTANMEKAPGLVGLGAFALVMSLLIWQQQLFHVNPLLACFGYHFFGAETQSGARVLVLSRTKMLSGGTLTVIRLSSYLWLHCPRS